MRQDPASRRWYADKDEVIRYLKARGLYEDSQSSSRINAVYAQVSEAFEVFSDVGYGFNAKRKNLRRLMKLVSEDKVEKVFVTHKDRLTRFGFEYLQFFFAEHGTEIVVLESTVNKDAQDELVEDMMSLLASFSGKYYGMRSSRKRKVAEQVLTVIREGEKGDMDGEEETESSLSGSRDLPAE